MEDPSTRPPLRRDRGEAGSVEPDPSAGAWPESMELNFFADSSMTIPGKNEPGEGCGEWAPREFCDRCGEVHMGPHRCQKRTCPDCWKAWMARRTESVVRRLQAARWDEPDGLRRRVVHAVASPPPGEVRTLADVARYRRKAHERMREAGVRGGVCIFHGFRVKEEAKEEFRDVRSGRDDIEGVWNWVRKNDRDWRAQTYWSPHFHYVGLCEDFDSDESDGWVLRRLSSASAFTSLSQVPAYKSVASMVSYVLSHATFETGESVKCVTWYGEVHPSQFQAEEELSEGAFDVIRRLSEQVAGGREDRGDGGEDIRGECEREECGGNRRPIFDAFDWLSDPEWSDSVDRERYRRLSVAFEWAVGEIHPPPGMRGPRSEEECREVFELLAEQRTAR